MIHVYGFSKEMRTSVRLSSVENQAALPNGLCCVTQMQINEGTPISTQPSNVFESITKGVVGSSKSDVKAVHISYWKSKLATKRQRLLSSFNQNDVIFDVFCGVGPIAISAAKIVKWVTKLSPLRM
ncbi:hypothetical protein ACFE04_029082 [Oxalis oulophora]